MKMNIYIYIYKDKINYCKEKRTTQQNENTNKCIKKIKKITFKGQYLLHAWLLANSLVVLYLVQSKERVRKRRRRERRERERERGEGRGR
jgi:hypothetical protein